jgi:hypothetical protein
MGGGRQICLRRPLATALLSGQKQKMVFVVKWFSRGQMFKKTNFIKWFFETGNGKWEGETGTENKNGNRTGAGKGTGSGNLLILNSVGYPLLVITICLIKKGKTFLLCFFQLLKK